MPVPFRPLDSDFDSDSDPESKLSPVMEPLTTRAPRLHPIPLSWGFRVQVLMWMSWVFVFAVGREVGKYTSAAPCATFVCVPSNATSENVVAKPPHPPANCQPLARAEFLAAWDRHADLRAEAAEAAAVRQRRWDDALSTAVEHVREQAVFAQYEWAQKHENVHPRFQFWVARKSAWEFLQTNQELKDFWGTAAYRAVPGYTVSTVVYNTPSQYVFLIFLAGRK